MIKLAPLAILSENVQIYNKIITKNDGWLNEKYLQLKLFSRSNKVQSHFNLRIWAVSKFFTSIGQRLFILERNDRLIYHEMLQTQQIYQDIEVWVYYRMKTST